MFWKSWKSPGYFFDLEKSLKSIQISQFSRELSGIPGNFRIPLQLQCLYMYKALILFLYLYNYVYVYIAFMIALWLLACIYYRLSFHCLKYILHFGVQKIIFASFLFSAL